MRFDTTTVVSPERKTKAHWELEPTVTSEKRQRITSPLKFSSIQKVSKKTLHKLPTPDAPLTKSVVYSSQSAPVSHGTQDLDQIRERIETTLNTIKEKQNIVQGAPYGNDLLSVEQQYNDHQNEHEDIMSLREEVEKTCKQTSHDDRIVKGKKTELKRLYSELVTSSVHRTRCLRSLLTFMNEATKELIWMNQKEEIETLRDWSDETLDVEEIEKYRTEFKTEMEMHEIQQRSVVGKGEHLLQSGHPAVQAIQAYVTSLRLQWTWIVELFQALEEHLLNAHAYHQFFDQVKENKLWMASKAEELRTKFLEKDNPSRAEIISLWGELMVERITFTAL